MRQRKAKIVACLCALPLIAACSSGPAQNGTLTVSWNPPTQNTDGTPVTDVTGYTIHYGTQPGVYARIMMTQDPSTTRAVIRGLQPGVEYFFAVSAHNAAGKESALSPEAHGKARPE